MALRPTVLPDTSNPPIVPKAPVAGASLADRIDAVLTQTQCTK
jgi:hypothetical protein